MLKIIRITEPAGINYIEEYVQAGEGDSAAETLSWLRQLLEQLPEQLLILVAFDEDDDKEPTVQAFLTAYFTTGAATVYLSQIWACDALVDVSIPKRLFFRFVCWVEGTGRSTILSDTEKDNDIFLTDWGFQHVSSNVRYTIPKDFDLTTIGGGDNGDRERTSIGESPEGQPDRQHSGSTCDTETNRSEPTVGVPEPECTGAHGDDHTGVQPTDDDRSSPTSPTSPSTWVSLCTDNEHPRKHV